MFVLEPRMRRIVYVIIFEALAILFSTFLLASLSGGPAHDSLPIAVAVSFIAVVWNYIFNTGFEACERRFQIPERTIKIRIVHAIGFELGLFIFTVPLYMIWFQVGVLDALVMEAAILVFFLIYTFIFTWIFDAFFVLPQHIRIHETRRTVRSDAVAGPLHCSKDTSR